MVRTGAHSTGTASDWYWGPAMATSEDPPLQLLDSTGGGLLGQQSLSTGVDGYQQQHHHSWSSHQALNENDWVLADSRGGVQPKCVCYETGPDLCPCGCELGTVGSLIWVYEEMLCTRYVVCCRSS